MTVTMTFGIKGKTLKIKDHPHLPVFSITDTSMFSVGTMIISMLKTQ